MRITLVRHTSVACDPSVCYGQTDVDVAASFPEEAKSVLSLLKKNDFDRIYSSPLQRCLKLAEYCGFHHLCLDGRLLELNFGDWEGKRWDEIVDQRLDEWYADWINVRTTNGESFMDQLERVEDFLNELKRGDSRNVLIFTHAGVIRCFAILLGKVKIELAFSDYSVGYGEIKEFEVF